MARRIDSCKSAGMRLALIAVLAGHGLLHLLGVAKAFGLVALPQLTQPIAPGRGLLWLTRRPALPGRCGERRRRDPLVVGGGGSGARHLDGGHRRFMAGREGRRSS